jgi:hypothetical protein
VNGRAFVPPGSLEEALLGMRIAGFYGAGLMKPDYLRGKERSGWWGTVFFFIVLIGMVMATSIIHTRGLRGVLPTCETLFAWRYDAP